MINEHIPDSLLEKIQKLLNLKDDKGASQGEIENATAMISALLMKYNLSMSQVEGHGKKKDPSITDNLFDLNGKQTRHEAGWVNTLFSVIARYNLCRTLNRKGTRGKDDMGQVRIIGTAMNIELVYYIVLGLIDKIRAFCAEAWRRYEYQGGPEKRNTFKRGFYRGCVSGIFDRLANDEEQRKSTEHLQIENHEMGLMVISNDQAIARYVNANISVKPGKAGKSLSGVGGYTQGYQTGQGMNIDNKMGQKRIS